MNGWKNPNPPLYEQEGACFWYVDVMEESGKWIGPPLKAVDDVIFGEITRGASGSSKRFWVIEGDGARGLKLKCWEPYEPQIPRRSDCVVLVLDGGLWGRVLQAEQVHRPLVVSISLDTFGTQRRLGVISSDPPFLLPNMGKCLGLFSLTRRFQWILTSFCLI